MKRAPLFALALALVVAAACGVPARSVNGGGPPPNSDLTQTGGNADLIGGGGDMSRPVQMGCAELQGCYTVYAHSDHVLYRVDLKNKLLVEIGPFKAPMVSGREDSITDLAVAPDDTVYVISTTNLYTANPTTGQVTLLGPVTSCGVSAVALTFAVDGKLYEGDHKGAFCRIDLTAKPFRVISIATLPNGLALAGDLVAVSDGTMYATVYTVNDAASAKNNTLVKIDPATGAIQTIGLTGYPRIFGTAYENGQVFGFTGDGSGDVVTIDPKTGVGTLYNHFNDPTTGKGIVFGGAGVNAKVDPMIM